MKASTLWKPRSTLGGFEGRYHIIVAVLFILSILKSTATAYAYPELVRHNYVNCTACHVSPSGGGVLTPYGRQLSKEILSSVSSENEPSFAYGLFKEREWINLGGDFRAAQIYRDTPRSTQADLIFMQADLEAALNIHKFTLDTTLGYQTEAERKSLSSESSILSRRHFLLYHFTDELTLRAGKFLFAYGINTPDHVTAIKRDLQMNDQGFETYNVEAAWLGETWNAYLTGVFGRPDQVQLKRDRGVALAVSMSAFQSYKPGISFFHGENDLRRRDVLGPFGILGFSPRSYLLTEFDFQNIRPNTSVDTATWGIANYEKLDYEFFQGFHTYLTFELSRPNFQATTTLKKSYGIGLQYFPRPHFEINASWQILVLAAQPGYTDFAWLLLHFYP